MKTTLLLLLGACADGRPPAGDSARVDSATPEAWTGAAQYGAGTTTGTIEVEGRAVPVRVWYPAAAPVAGTVPLADLVVDADDRAALAGLVADAPAGCPGADQPVAIDAPPASAGPLPLVGLSHCHTCLGLSNATIARRLAEAGYVVVAPDHVGNTLFDLLDGDGGALDEATLVRRAADLRAALDAAPTLVPDGLPLDPEAVAVVGHSFGSVTAGRVLSEDPRPVTGVFLAAPIDNPLLRGVDAATVSQPTMFVLLEEDNSVGLPGNTLIAGNFAEVAGPSTLARVADAGHWSVSDLCGVVDAFQPGCGAGRRHEGGADFNYIDADAGRETAALLVLAHLETTLGRRDLSDWLAAPVAPATVTTASR